MSKRFTISLEEILEVDKVHEEILESDLEIEDTKPLDQTIDLIKEGEENSDQVTEAIDVTTTLESIAVCLEESIAHGGLSQTASKIVNIATIDLYKKVGIKSKSQNAISFENFNSVSNRNRNTKLAIESISDFALKIWNAIVDAITRSIEWIKKIIRSIFNDYEKFKNNIKKLRSILVTTQKDILFDVNKYKTFTDIPQKYIFNKSTIISKLKAGSSTDFPSNIKDLTHFTDLFFDNIDKEQHKVISNIRTIIENVSKNGHDSPDVVDFLHNLPSGVVKNKVTGYTPELKTLECYSYTKVLPGDSLFVAHLPNISYIKQFIASNKDNKNYVSEINNIVKKSKFIFGTHQDNLTPLDAFPVVPKSNVLQLLDSLEKLCNEGLKSEKIFDNFIKDKSSLQKDLKDLIKQKDKVSKVDKIVDTINKIKDDSYKKKPRNSDLDYVSSRIQMIENTYVAGAAKLSTIILQTLSAGVNYSNFCVNCYKSLDV